MIDYSAVIQAAHAAGALVVMAADILALTLAETAGRIRRRHRRRLDAAVRRSAGIRRPARRVYGHAIAIRPQNAGPDRRRLQGFRRSTGPAPGHPNPRAAHPPRQGHQQHLHRPGPAGRDGRHVRRLSRPGRIAHDRPPRARADGRAGGGIARLGHDVADRPFFDTLRIHVNGLPTESILAAAQRADTTSATSVTATSASPSTKPPRARMWRRSSNPSPAEPRCASTSSNSPPRQPKSRPILHASSEFLTHPIFNRHHSETEMLRYIFRLMSRDLSLAQSMIPLGSCTMKLNGTSEMLPVTWPEFSRLHPFAPADQARGYAEMFAKLEDWLAKITGFSAVSLQPNAGSQGEYAGLLAIRAYHESPREPGPPHGLPDPDLSPRHQSRQRRRRGDARRRRRLRRRGNIDLADLQSQGRSSIAMNWPR